MALRLVMHLPAPYHMVSSFFYLISACIVVRVYRKKKHDLLYLSRYRLFLNNQIT